LHSIMGDRERQRNELILVHFQNRLIIVLFAGVGEKNQKTVSTSGQGGSAWLVILKRSNCMQRANLICVDVL